MIHFDGVADELIEPVLLGERRHCTVNRHTDLLGLERLLVIVLGRSSHRRGSANQQGSHVGRKSAFFLDDSGIGVDGSCEFSTQCPWMAIPSPHG